MIQVKIVLGLYLVLLGELVSESVSQVSNLATGNYWEYRMYLASDLDLLARGVKCLI